MLAPFVNLPHALRATLVLLFAVAAMRFANWAIYSWAYNSRRLGPWAPAIEGGSRSWLDQLPVLGWHRLRRESSVHGKSYWIRPLLLELVVPVLLTWYYCHYVTGGSLPFAMVARPLAPNLTTALHWQYLAQFILFTLMTIATFIDFDEQSIPDYVTIPGTVIGLAGAALAPAWLPFHTFAGGIVELDAAIPLAWPTWFNGVQGLVLGLAIVLVWGFALLDRRWVARRGMSKAIQYFFARMFRERFLWMTVCVVTAFMLIGVAFAWYQLNPSPPGRWNYLLSSLFGLAFAGGVTWAVRISATVGLGVEALGFGDVTLMAMIGTYIGWQPSLLVFFLAPIIAIAFVLLRALITGETATPYGPYLCAAVVVLLVFWDPLWNVRAAPVFALGNIILGIVVACVFLMGALLWIWRLIKQAIGLGGH